MCFILFVAISIFLYQNFKFKTHKFNLQNIPNLEVGDLIFRHGNTIDSIIISNKSDFKYSHVGVIIKTEPILIIHATQKENDDKVSIITLNEFLNNATDFGIARVKFINDKNRIFFINDLKNSFGKKFVLSKKGDENLYCTTLIENSLSKISKFEPIYQDIDFMFIDGKYLFPAGIWYDKNIEILYEN
ncbi:YiiX/YebB-like N1pC/P60 family cysteine hydrolase [Campylobacter portucalensis]|uniref:YiiX/YebB-like N1pC/P60 family cysteine hydrolase n=1 Tax=Campylobacter portucalensis TaxID=2608384 RepID=UPI001E2980AC|nr:YiiX/YebB-like N1pC/P60 family cysteine hydrolase [Campylobacter portucalensis]